MTVPTDSTLAGLSRDVGVRLLAASRVLVTAESCTGGWIAKLCTDIAGSSDWFDCGFVCYSNAAKTRDLGVPEKLIESEGAVSDAVVRAMAEGALERTGANVAIAVSGIAGPGGAMSGMIMRVGQSAESFAWAAVFILMPVSGVYYPVTVLPHWLQVIAWGLPPAYVFEGMRSILAEKTVHWDMLAIAFGLSVVYLVIGFQIFQWFFRASRRAGTLLGQGE